MKKGQAKKIGVKLVNVTEKAAKKLVLDIHEGLVVGTPVDTGWARSNWLLSVGKSVTSPVGSKEKISVAEQNAGVGSILGWKFTQGPAYDTNNVPYIRTLNGGSSKQAPRGFIELTIQRVVSSFNRKRLE